MGRRGLIWLVAVVSLLIAFFGSFELHSRGVSTVGGGDGTAQAATVRDQVVRALQQSYYLPINKAVLRAHGLHGVLRALHDPYTQYLSPHAYQLVVTEEQSRFVGVGMAFTHVPGGLAVTATLPGLPAAAAGLRPGDLITQIGLESLAPLSYDRDVRLLRGPVGSRVSLVVRRQHQPPRTLTLERTAVDLPNVFSRSIRYHGREYSYLRLPGFVAGVAERIREVAERASSDHRAGLILDLRGNMGGLLDEAVNVADVFQGSGVVVALHGLHEPRHVYSADDKAVADLPVAVLVDSSTASAAEVVAGALQRAHRAVVVGTRSFGKGTVQAVQPLQGGGALKLTVAVFSLAGGERVNRRGIIPDVRVVNRPFTRVDEVLRRALGVLAHK
jgi:carboxyl-terminal processing protease